ncbi:extracellular solute-binding protein [Alkalihalophilus sp. As8PL]|uniref:Extracellular solute-binding protein n=1 Tax=Alkalihalophilus sp. As8PL TaxID=3237103 RepID=A0AB39BWB5_9BACI
MMKKWFMTMGISTVLLGSVLAGCGNNGGESTSGENSNDGEVTQITLTGWQSSPQEQKYLDQTIALFEEQNPDIEVTISTIPDSYMDVLRTRLIGGDGPDVFYLDAFEAPGLIETGVVEPLDEYISEDFDLNDFEQPLLDAFRGNDDTIYGLPKDTSTLALFYNKDLLEEAGFDAPPATWEELEEMAEALTTDSTYGYGVVPDLARLMFIAESNGGQVVTDNQASFGDSAVVEALQPVVDMRNEAGTAAEPSEVGSDNGGEMFALGRAAMIMEGNWTIPFLDENFPDVNYGVAEIPTINGEQGTMAFTVSYVMNAASDKKEASWRLIEFLTGKEGMEAWTASGLTLPTRASVAETLDYTDDEIYGPFVAGTSYATVWSDDTNLPIINNNFGNQFISAFLGQRDLGEALEEAEDVANREIQ